MSTNDEIDEKLARIGRRVEAQRLEVRAELERSGLLGFVEAAKSAFSGRLTWFKSDTLEHGRELPRGIVPAYYEPPASESGYSKAQFKRLRSRT